MSGATASRPDVQPPGRRGFHEHLAAVDALFDPSDVHWDRPDVLPGSRACASKRRTTAQEPRTPGTTLQVPHPLLRSRALICSMRAPVAQTSCSASPMAASIRQARCSNSQGTTSIGQALCSDLAVNIAWCWRQRGGRKRGHGEVHSGLAWFSEDGSRN